MAGSMKHGSATLRSNLSWVVNQHLIILFLFFALLLLWNCSDCGVLCWLYGQPRVQPITGNLKQNSSQSLLLRHRKFGQIQAMPHFPLQFIVTRQIWENLRVHPKLHGHWFALQTVHPRQINNFCHAAWWNSWSKNKWAFRVKNL